MEEEAEMAVRLSDSNGDGLLGLEDFTKLMEGTEEDRNKESELIGAFVKIDNWELGHQCDAVSHWKITIGKMASVAMHRYLDGPLKNDNCHLAGLRDMVMCQ
ncbi:putative cytochrome 83B1-like [Capsicum annuum]|nr:putative cytochrome 83B1-like [Capsicum annuum]